MKPWVLMVIVSVSVVWCFLCGVGCFLLQIQPYEAQLALQEGIITKQFMETQLLLDLLEREEFLQFIQDHPGHSFQVDQRSGAYEFALIAKNADNDFVSRLVLQTTTRAIEVQPIKRP